MTMDSQLLATAIDTLPEQPAMDVVLDHLNHIDAIKKFIKEYEPKLKAYLVAEIERTGKPVVQGGGFIWTMTQKKSVKCNDVKTAAEAIYQVALAATGNEKIARERMADCLASEAFKPGTAGKTLAEFGQPELFDGLFTTDYKTNINGEPLRELAMVNTAFLK